MDSTDKLDNGTWRDSGFNRAQTVTEVRDSPIRAAMLELLIEGGANGVPWQGFKNLDWRPPFSAVKLARAMYLLAKNNGYRLQYQGVRTGKVGPTRWRLAP